MATPKKRLSWAEMDHDEELLWEKVTRSNAVTERGPLPEFLAKKRAEQEPKTFLGYQTALSRFRDFLGEDATIHQFDETAGHNFLSHLKGIGLSENTIATYFRCLKALSRWMAKKGWTERDRFEDVKRPRFVRPKFDTLTTEQKQAILSSFNIETFLGARNVAILCLFLDTGVRLEELAHAKAARVHLDEGYVEVYGRKTKEWRIIPLSPETIAVCVHYIKVRDRFLGMPIRHRLTSDDVNHRRKSARTLQTDNFFCSWKGEELTENGIGLMVRRLRRRLAQAGLMLRIHPHLFRHNFLTEKALDGENPSLVRRWAGHKSYEMTDYYFGLAESKLAAIKPKQSTLAGISILPQKRGRRRREEIRPPVQAS